MQKLFENFRKFLNEAPEDRPGQAELAALKQKMDAVKKKMYKTQKWNRQAANLAGDVYAVQRAIEEYLQQQ